MSQLASLGAELRSRPWQLGNTTVRNPYRLLIGLKALMEAGFNGNMGRDQELAISHALKEAGVVTLSPQNDKDPSIARKWRSVLQKMGFLWLPSAQTGPGIGKPLTLTPNGSRLITAADVQTEQEVLLSALAAVRKTRKNIGVSGETGDFSPLRHVIRILAALESMGFEASISRVEMAAIVQLTDSFNDLKAAANNVAVSFAVGAIEIPPVAIDTKLSSVTRCCQYQIMNVPFTSSGCFGVRY